MQNHQQEIIDSPPPYQLQTDGIYLPDMDLNAWPSSYYGRTRRIDLAKFYHDILKASSSSSSSNGDQCSNDNNGFNDSSSSSSSSEEEEENQNQNSVAIGVTQPRMMRRITENKKKVVTFSNDPPTIFEYEPECGDESTTTNSVNTGVISLFDDGWPGRTKTAMKSTGFMDFKSKIEAKLGAINDPLLISQLDSSNENIDQNCLLYKQEEGRGYYRHRKSPLVQKLSLRPIPNDKQPHLMDDGTPSPSNSFTDSPLTPKDDALLLGELSSTSILSPGGSKWLNRTLSKLRSNNSTSSRSK